MALGRYVFLPLLHMSVAILGLDMCPKLGFGVDEPSVKFSAKGEQSQLLS